MKKILIPVVVAFALFSVYTFLNNRCVSFGYDNVVFSTKILCVKTTVSEEYQYEASTYTPLKELEGDAKEYKPLPKPIPTLEVNTF